MLSNLLIFAFLSISWTVSASVRRAYDTHDYYVLEIDSEPEHYINQLGVELVEQAGELEGFWLVRAQKNLKREQQREEDPILARYNSIQPNPIKSLTLQTLRKRTKRAPPSPSELASKMGIQDPLFPDQWHILNPESPEHMMNVTGLWEEGYTGLGVISSLIDDGLDYTSEDLAANFDAVHSHDYNDHVDLPTPKLPEDTHGTRCAGQIAAVKNGICGLGLAYHSRVAAVRILSGTITDVDEAAALNQGFDEVSIYSCSWGPPDDGRTMDGPDYLIRKAIVNGVNRGRQGKGSIFVFATGNGKGSGDECNYDGYTNSIWSVTVGAADWTGRSPYYSEACAANMIVAYSSGNGKSIVTTDKGKNQCSRSHGGTSAAAPNVVGVIALALQARPELGWRDIQHLCVRTAIPINYDPSSPPPSSPSDTDYELTAARRPFSYAFGYGAIDAYTFVHAALKWDLVPRQAWMRTRTIVLDDGKMTKDKVFSGGIPFGQSKSGGEVSVSSTLEVTEKMMSRARFAPQGLEHVNVRVWIEHQRRGDVRAEIVSPNGIKSVLAGVSSGDGGRKYDKAKTGFPGWLFMSVKHWDENPLGTWTITVSDPVNTDFTGKFLGWNMVFWGSSTDTSISAQEDKNKYEIPVEDGNVFPPPDDDIDEEEDGKATVTITATETLTGSTTRIYTKPTNFLSTGINDDVEASTTSTSTSASSTSSSNLGKIFSSQRPVYAIFELLFLIGIGVVLYVFLWRRRKQASSADYEALAGQNLAMSRIPGDRERSGRPGGGGEMYEAFDGNSDEGEGDEDDEAGVEQPMLPRSARTPREAPSSAAIGQSRYQDEPSKPGVQESMRIHTKDDDSGSSGSWEHT
ncbi:peptidase S8/S53 domain-containing protein [Lentinula aciculospora]|uniref:Peptidase S8/S53 domain-containing protein n=1 Tax=Lentinula aciculospora TaxID=153920 RepID=A0A9W9DXX2_9AGAR|nr:peptidase S8/S53 domain-containing protein [Lentinula aciculospora]